MLPPDPLLPPPSQTPLIAAALSGGVDSAVAAALLKAQGYRLVGITLQLNAKTGPRHAKACCAGADIYDAKRLAAKLDIPHYVLDYQSQFHREVIDPFVNAYASGKTPSPCATCNQKIKFGQLLDFARSVGAAYLATGHYVRRVMTQDGMVLRRAADKQRDQSYFLFALNADQLAHSVFPLGDLTKEAVRGLAKKLSLPLADKPASQDLCFAAGKPYWQAVEQFSNHPLPSGTLRHVDGRVLGKHGGLHRYTLGQRRGLGIAGEMSPLFVVDIDAKTNSVTLGPKEALETSRIALEGVNWLPARQPDAKGEPVQAKLRSSGRLLPARLYHERHAPYLQFEKPALRPAPGQACTFYGIGDNEDLLLGGGWAAASP